MDLQDLTIVVITFSRQRFIDRQVAYWKNSGAKLLILDGSAKAHPNSGVWNLTSNISYIHSPTTYRDRHLMAADLVATKYAILLNDDEFLLNPGISQCVELLESNLLVDCVSGRAINFFYKNGEVYGQRIYKSFSNVDDCIPPGVERMREFWNDPDGYVRHYTIFSVMRQTVFANLIKQTFATEHSNPYAYEIRMHLLTPLQYKSVLINELVWLRSGENDPVSIKGFDRSIRFSTWYLDPLNVSEIKAMLDDITECVKEDIDLYEVELRDEILRQLNEYVLADSQRYIGMSREVSPSITKRMVTQFKSASKRIIVARFPNSIRRKLTHNSTTLIEAAEEWSAIGVGVDSAEVKKLLQLIINFHRSE